ncbi:nuclear envelope phosphatase-regulatory subunit 1-like [Oppia nitens]|uniref:nuclear envelope phosphatase-regulatory subunit 1-like n=1 Tax=Oppia nitens TaxID=1686743 RepID=UPI0023DB007E|nr:nuclear envelope phosphatase-regulatory subunit 1-like [Oppia nitens]
MMTMQSQTIQYTTDQMICDDLKAFERRLMEIVSIERPATRRWRIILLVSSLSTSVSAFNWLNDPQTAYISLLDSLIGHYLFTINCLILIALFSMGIHKRVVATSIIISRTRQVLADFAMSCDDNGRLILKPRQQMKNNIIEHLKI